MCKNYPYKNYSRDRIGLLIIPALLFYHFNSLTLSKVNYRPKGNSCIKKVNTL